MKPKAISLGEQLKSQRTWNVERLDRAFSRKRSGRVFDFLTAGTGNKRPEELVAMMVTPVFSCYCLVDVRNNPNSRHTPYWDKNRISQLLAKRGIEYIHVPDLGVPSEIRKRLRSGEMSYDQFFSWYDGNILSSAKFEEVAELAKRRVVTLLCTEVGPTYCHRHRIALKLESKLGYVSFDL